MNLKVAFKIHPILAALTLAALLILSFALFRGCKKSKMEVAAKEKAIKLADSALNVLREYKISSDSTQVEFSIKDELQSGQIALLQNQNARYGADLGKVLGENKILIEKYKQAKYTDSTAVIVPSEFVDDCKDCFTKLETTSALSLRYKNDVNVLEEKYRKQNESHQARFKQLEAEKLGFYNKMQSLAVQAKEATDKLKPHGRLYLSWGVLWHGWPSAAGAGLMYQTKYNMIYGVKYYYGVKGSQIETTMNFPLSIKF